MDALTATVVWGVLWFVSMGVFPFVGFLVGVFLGALFDTRGDDAVTAGAFLGWIVGGAAAVFSLIQVILHIISFVRLVS